MEWDRFKLKKRDSDFSSRKSKDLMIIELSGGLNGHASDVAQKLLIKHIQSGEKNLIIDLNTVTFVSSAFIRTIAIVLQKLKAVSGHLAFSRVPKPIKHVLELSGVESHVKTFDSIEEAESFLGNE